MPFSLRSSFYRNTQFYPDEFRVWFIYRKVELRYGLVDGNVKNNNNKNKNTKLVEWKAFVDTLMIKSADLKNEFLF